MSGKKNDENVELLRQWLAEEFGDKSADAQLTIVNGKKVYRESVDVENEYVKALEYKKKEKEKIKKLSGADDDWKEQERRLAEYCEWMENKKAAESTTGSHYYVPAPYTIMEDGTLKSEDEMEEGEV